MAMKKACLMCVLVVLLVAGGVSKAQGNTGGEYAEAPEAAAVQQADCSDAMEELSVCNASVGAATPPASECCDTLRSLGPQCMCNVFLGPPIPGLSRDQALLLPRDCNLPRIRCTTPAPTSPSDSAAASSVAGGSVFFLGVDDEEQQQQQQQQEPQKPEWPEQKQRRFY